MKNGSNAEIVLLGYHTA